MKINLLMLELWRDTDLALQGLMIGMIEQDREKLLEASIEANRVLKANSEERDAIIDSMVDEVINIATEKLSSYDGKNNDVIAEVVKEVLNEYASKEKSDAKAE